MRSMPKGQNGRLPPAHRLRVLHTSDTHLDANHTERDGYWPARRLLMNDAFSRVVDIAMGESVDALVLAGDIFDHRRPGQEAVEFLIAELRRFGRPAILLPGNHDAYEDGSVFRTVDFELAAPNIRVVRSVSGELIEDPDLGVVFWGRAYTDAEHGFRPLAGIPTPTRDRAWHVAVAHGHFIEDAVDSYRSQLIRAGEIAASGWDYLALGHWEHVQDVSQGGTVAVYSGAPLPLFDVRRQFPTGFAAMVTLDPEEGVTVEMRRVDPRDHE